MTAAAAMGPVLDVSFPVAGGPVPADHAALLRSALLEALPWLDDEPGAAVHPLRRVTHIDGHVVLGAHSRLVLRLPVARLDACAALEGRSLAVGESVQLGRGQRRPLLAFPTLYSSLVVTGDLTEDAFLATVHATLDRWQGRCDVVVGRAAARKAGSAVLEGFSLMLHGAAPALSLRAQIEGVGRYRQFGCGVFVPHRSADAVSARGFA